MGDMGVTGDLALTAGEDIDTDFFVVLLVNCILFYGLESFQFSVSGK